MSKFKAWIEKRKLRKYKITPKGMCFKDYCEKIIKDEWVESDYIEEYEKQINELIIMANEKTPEQAKFFTEKDKRFLICNELFNLLNDFGGLNG
ncbi:hypothetical protein IJD44_00895 [bacterium]|nr:hypothetical protein [bacterium]